MFRNLPAPTLAVHPGQSAVRGNMSCLHYVGRNAFTVHLLRYASCPLFCIVGRQ